MKISDSKVAKVAIEVEALASFGILSKELFSIMKLIRVKTAHTIAKINFQLKIKRIILSRFIRFPEIRDLSPKRTIEAVLATQ